MNSGTGIGSRRAAVPKISIRFRVNIRSRYRVIPRHTPLPTAPFSRESWPSIAQNPYDRTRPSARNRRLAIDQLRELNGRICKELSRIIIGQNEVIEKLLICIFGRGHALLMGVPGWRRRCSCIRSRI